MDAHQINDAAIQEGLNRLAVALGDMTRPMERIGEAMVHSSQQRIEDGISVDGAPFAPRSKATLARYTASGERFSSRPLWKTGTMRNQIFAATSSDAAEIGSNAIQAAVMQFGAKQGEFGARAGRTRPKKPGAKPRDYFFHLPWGDIPARPFLGVSEEDRANVLEIIDEWMNGVASG